MVKTANQSGLRDWLAQRFTALLIGAYTLFIVLYWLLSPNTNYHQWHNLFGSVWIKLFTFIVFISILWHAWIGLWTVLTDYVKNPYPFFSAESDTFNSSCRVGVDVGNFVVNRIEGCILSSSHPSILIKGLKQ